MFFQRAECFYLSPEMESCGEKMEKGLAKCQLGNNPYSQKNISVLEV